MVVVIFSVCRVLGLHAQAVYKVIKRALFSGSLCFSSLNSSFNNHESSRSTTIIKNP